jgi:hypothetical protein
MGMLGVSTPFINGLPTTLFTSTNHVAEGIVGVAISHAMGKSIAKEATQSFNYRLFGELMILSE